MPFPLENRREYQKTKIPNIFGHTKSTGKHEGILTKQRFQSLPLAKSMEKRKNFSKTKIPNILGPKNKGNMSNTAIQNIFPTPSARRYMRFPATRRSRAFSSTENKMKHMVYQRSVKSAHVCPYRFKWKRRISNKTKIPNISAPQPFDWQNVGVWRKPRCRTFFPTPDPLIDVRNQAKRRFRPCWPTPNPLNIRLSPYEIINMFASPIRLKA